MTIHPEFWPFDLLRETLATTPSPMRTSRAVPMNSAVGAFIKSGKRRGRPLLRGPSAIDEDVRAGDEAGFFGADVEGETADLAHVAPAAEGDLGDELGVSLGGLEDGHVHFG